MRNIFANLLAVSVIQTLFVNGVYAQFEFTDKDAQFAQSLLQELRAGVDDEKLLAAILVARPHDEVFANELLLRALQSLDHDPLLLSTAIQSCFSELPASSCTDNALFEELIQVDHNNLEPYLYYTVRLAEAGNFERAMEVLNEGLETERHSIYFYEKADLLEPQLVSFGYQADEASFPAAIYAGSSTNYALFVKILSICKTQSVSNADWKLACLFLGAKMQNTSEDLMPKVFGGAIQRDVLIAVGADQDIIQLVIEHNEWINKVRDIANEKVDWMSTSATTLDQPASFVEETRKATEFEAILRQLYRTQ